MADIIKNSNTLSIECLFIDGDTRTITLKNPKTTIAESTIASISAYAQEHNIIIGDKYGGDFGRITKATKKTTVTRQLDFS